MSDLIGARINGNHRYFWEQMKKLTRQQRAELIESAPPEDQLEIALYIIRGFKHS
ncbi:MAG: hypothetical protein HOH69_09485 [Gammaproteobacteria bacterium]|nr:hypothetical protein [Gammaproteobacteria bacterium]